MSEKSPQFERSPVRVFGRVPEEVKEEISERIARQFSEGRIENLPNEIVERIKAAEYPKKPFEIEIIAESNRQLNKFINHYHIQTFDIPEKNIHILPPDVYHEAGFSKTSDSAIQNSPGQFIAINRDGPTKHSPTLLAKTILHEMTHNRGFLSFDIAEKSISELNPEQSGPDEYRSAPRRDGLLIFEGYRKDDQREFYINFIGLNEAVVSEIEQRLGKKLLENLTSIEIREALELKSSERFIKEAKKISEKKKIPIEDLEWISKEDYIRASYSSHRKVLELLTREIGLQTNRTQEDIYDLFFKAHFDGNILTLSRLIEETFGHGSFRVIGMMDIDPKSANRLLDYLKKQRIRIKNNEKEN